MVDLVMAAQGQSTAAKSSESAPAPLSNLEAEMIGLFVEFARVLGLPRSLAEIYGLLFISVAPLPMDELIARLALSKGSASQGLRFLRNAGAVRMIYVPGDRRVHYEAVAQLRQLGTRYLRDQILPHLDAGLSRLDQIGQMVKQLPPDQRARLSPRVTMLHSWEKKTRRVLPLVLKLLGG